MANVLITGCSSGFGLLSALEFARRGDTVFASMRTVSKATALNDAAAAEGLKVEVVSLDVTDDDSVRSAVAGVAAEAGTIDVLVNNAGIEMNGAIHLIADDEARWQLDTNVLGPLRTMRAVVPIMLHQGGGTIVNVSSVAGVAAVPYSGMYAASKHALEAMTEAMHYELSHKGIRFALDRAGAVHNRVREQLADGGGDGRRHRSDGPTLAVPRARWERSCRRVRRPILSSSRTRSSTQRRRRRRSCECPWAPTPSSSPQRARAWTSRASSTPCARR